MVQVKIRLSEKFNLDRMDRGLVQNLLIQACGEGAFQSGDIIYAEVSHDIFSALCMMEDMGILEVEQC